MYCPPSSPSRWSEKALLDSARMRWVADLTFFTTGFGFWRPARTGRQFFLSPTRLKVVGKNGFGSAAEFPPVVGPDPLAPITIATGLGAEQVKKRVAIARVGW